MSRHNRFNRPAAPQNPPQDAPSPATPALGASEPESASQAKPGPLPDEIAKSRPVGGSGYGLVRNVGRGAYQGDLGGTKLCAPVPPWGTVSVPESAIADALRRGFEFVRWAQG